jgi:hypothetical protein
VARPRVWQPFDTVKWASGHEFTDAGDIRDKHRNVLPIGAAPDYNVSLRLYDTARKFPRRDILAMEFHGIPERPNCVICDKKLKCSVVHLDGDPQNFARDNLKWVTSIESHEHEQQHLRWAMVSNDVPPRCKTRRKRHERLRRHVQDSDDWGDPTEEIPRLGVNKGKKSPDERRSADR